MTPEQIVKLINRKLFIHQIANLAGIITGIVVTNYWFDYIHQNNMKTFEELKQKPELK